MHTRWERWVMLLGVLAACSSTANSNLRDESGIRDGTDGTRGDAASVSDTSHVKDDSSNGSSDKKNTCYGPPPSALANARLPAGYCAWTWASSLTGPRGAARSPDGDLLVVERGLGQITLLFDDNQDGISSTTERVALASAAGLNHGIAVGEGFLYASSATTVFRWPYTGGREPLGTPQAVVSRLPSGGHSTRTLLLDNQGNLYVSIGSAGNVDRNSDRSRILRFSKDQLTAGATMPQGMLFADGLRNEVGMAYDSLGRLWGVENGLDNLNRADLGGDIHTDNPGEELNLFAEPGRFYGYPYCWSEYLLPSGTGLGPGTQWAHPDFMTDGTHGDAWCRDTTQVVPPVALLPAHTAPLDMVFYTGGSFPADTVGDALVSLHGSWNRQPPSGYKVVRIPFGPDHMPSGDPVSLLESASSGNPTQAWPHRPVGLVVGTRGEVFVTSDTSGVVIAIGYHEPSTGP